MGFPNHQAAGRANRRLSTEHPRLWCRTDSFPAPVLPRWARRAASDAGVRPAVGCPVRQDHIMLALTRLAIGVDAMFTDNGLGIGLP